MLLSSRETRLAAVARLVPVVKSIVGGHQETSFIGHLPV
jgi:hypothetical protein